MGCATRSIRVCVALDSAEIIVGPDTIVGADAFAGAGAFAGVNYVGVRPEQYVV
jgi:hypothetical protein